MPFQKAIAAHNEWKVRFRTAIFRGEPIALDTVRDDHACTFGQWLSGEEAKQYIRSLSFQRVCVAHVTFHQCAVKVAEAINAKHFDMALMMVEGDSAYSVASHNLIDAIANLERECLKTG